MDHPRKIIRQGVVDLLKAGSTAAGNHVYDTHATNLFPDDLPAICVHTQSERLKSQENQDFGLRRRTMVLGVECYHVGKNGAQAVDKMAWQVENILHGNPTLGNLVEWCHLRESTMAFADDGTQVLHAVVMSFDVTYCTHLYEVEGEPPVTVLYGFDPETGIGHEDDYFPLGGAPHA